MLTKQKSPSLPRNLALTIFGKLLIVFSTKVNLLYLFFSMAPRGCLLHLIKQNRLLKTFLRTLIFNHTKNMWHKQGFSVQITLLPSPTISMLICTCKKMELSFPNIDNRGKGEIDFCATILFLWLSEFAYVWLCESSKQNNILAFIHFADIEYMLYLLLHIILIILWCY